MAAVETRSSGEPKSLGQVFSQVGVFLGALSGTQRLWLVGAAVVVAATLAVFVRMLARPDYKTLYSGLTPADAQALGAGLAAKNIAYEISPEGSSILVPVDKLDVARVETASQGLPRNARLGFELFDKPNWAGSDFTEKVNYQRALEGELERTLGSIRGVEAARVHLVMPQESVFTERERAAKAAVILKARPGAVTEETESGIAQLVASAVDNLQAENVTVMDADTQRPLSQGRQGRGVAAGSSALDQELEQKLLRTLEPVVGAGRVRVSVHVEMDPSSRESTEESYDPKSQVAVSTQRSEERAGAGTVGGVPGTSSNVPGAQPAGVQVTPGSEQQASLSESQSFAVNKSVRHTVEPPGRIKKIAAALVVDDAVEVKQENGQAVSAKRKRTPEELKQIEQLAGAALGVDAARGDLLAVENIAFPTVAVEAPAPPSVAERVEVGVAQWSYLLRYAGIAALFLVVYMLVLGPVRKQVVTSFRELPAKLAARTPVALAAGRPPAAPEAEVLPEVELPAGSAEARKAVSLKRALVDKVKAEPAGASRLLQTWMREGS